MAKGIPVIGRAPDKKAKIINVDELGNLKVSQLESKLDGIENKLVALEQKLTDGSQKVTLSGPIDSLLYSLTSDKMMESAVRFLGENVATANSVISIDISGASEVAVVLENKHDVAIRVTRMCLTRQARQVPDVGYANVVYQELKTTSIPAGASVYLDKEIYETLGKIGVGLVLLIEREAAPTSGNLRMLVYGRRN